MPLNRFDIETALTQKGFIAEDRDHRFFTYQTNQGRKTSVYTKTSFGTKYKTIDDSTVSQMSKQCKVTNAEFKQLVGCSLTRDAYEQLLVTRGYIRVDA